MSKICLTFDYELFFGRSGTFLQSIYKPTKELLSLFNKFDIKATFFIDVLYYMRLVETRNEDAVLFKEQIQEMVHAGHRIELHLHPHWIDAYYQKPEWIFRTYDHYRLQSLTEEKITDLFITGCQILNEIGSSVIADYRVKAFRAGGWCIEPFDKLAEGFRKSGIVIDSSVARGIVIPVRPFDTDFSTAPKRNYYKFTIDPLIPENKGDFYEIPITTFPRNFFDKILSKAESSIHRRFNQKDYLMNGDGSSISMDSNPKLTGIRNRLLKNYGFLSIEQVSSFLLSYNIWRSGMDLLVIMSHPKNISPGSLKCIEYLCKGDNSFYSLYDLLKCGVFGDKEV